MTQDLIAAECSVLSAAMQSPEAFIKAHDILEPQDFYSEKHRAIFSACIDLHTSGQKSDIVSVSNHLRNKGSLDKCGGASYISQVGMSMPTSELVRHHASIVQRAAVVRRINQWAALLKESTQDGHDDIPGLLGSMQRDIVALADTMRDKRSPYISNILTDMLAQWKEFQVAKKEAQKNTGRYCNVPLFKPFNAESPIPYYMPGNLIMLAGYTSAGKSTTLAQLLCDACYGGAHVLGFSLEEGRTTKAIKMIANITDTPQKYLLTGEYGEERIGLINDAMDTLKAWGVMWYDDVRTLDEICLKSKKHALQGQIDIIAVDYVQNIQGSGISIYNDMREVGPRLLDLAIDLKCTVVALSQVNNESMRGDSEIIGLKGAGELAAAADIVLWLKRVKGDDHALDCEIRKNRAFGETGIIELAFSDRYTQIIRRRM